MFYYKMAIVFAPVNRDSPCTQLKYVNGPWNRPHVHVMKIKQKQTHMQWPYILRAYL